MVLWLATKFVTCYCIFGCCGSQPAMLHSIYLWRTGLCLLLAVRLSYSATYYGHDDESDEPATSQWQSNEPAPVLRPSWRQQKAYVPPWETRPANSPQGNWKNEQNKPVPQGAWRSRPTNNPQGEEWRPTPSSTQDEWRIKLAKGPQTEWRGKPQAEWKSKQTSIPQGDWRSKKSDPGPQQDWRSKPGNVPQREWKSRPTSAPQTEQKSKSPHSWSVHGYGPATGAVRPQPSSSSTGSWSKGSQAFPSSGSYRSTFSHPALVKPQKPETQRVGSPSSSPQSIRPPSSNSGPNLPPWAKRDQKTQSQSGSLSWKRSALSQRLSAQGQRLPSGVSGGNYNTGNRGQNTAPTSTRWTQQSQADDDDDEDVMHVPIPAGHGQGTLLRKRW